MTPTCPLLYGLIVIISMDRAPSFPDFLLRGLQHRCVSKTKTGSCARRSAGDKCMRRAAQEIPDKLFWVVARAYLSVPPLNTSVLGKCTKPVLIRVNRFCFGRNSHAKSRQFIVTVRAKKKKKIHTLGCPDHAGPWSTGRREKTKCSLEQLSRSLTSSFPLK